jgi:hypothetical protein
VVEMFPQTACRHIEVLCARFVVLAAVFWDVTCWVGRRIVVPLSSRSDSRQRSLFQDQAVRLRIVVPSSGSSIPLKDRGALVRIKQSSKDCSVFVRIKQSVSSGSSSPFRQDLAVR